MDGCNDTTVLMPPGAQHSGFYASGGGCNNNNGNMENLLGQLHNNNAIWNSGAFNTAAMDRFGYAILSAVEHNGRDNIVETGRTAAATQIAIEKTGAATALAIAVNTSQIQLQAERHTADTLRAIAECCCELKEGQAATNALILSTEAARVRDELAAARNELNLLKLGVGVPVGGLRA